MLVTTQTRLVAVALFVGMASVTVQQSPAPRKCSTTQTTACVNCSQVGTCGTNRTLTATATPCSSSQVCQEYGNTALCVPASGNNTCNNCGSQPTACDPFNTSIVHACLPGQAPLLVQNCALATKPSVCSAGACVAGASTSVPINPADVCAGNTDPVKYYSLKPACTSGVLCSTTNVALIFNCTSGNYFNQISKSCKSLPVNHCEGITPDGISASLTNCSNGVVCQGGAVVTEIQCGTGQVFDSTQNGCIVRPANFNNCPPMDGCALTSSGSAATTSPPGQLSSTTTSPPGQSSSTITSPPGQLSSTTASPPGQSSSTITRPPGQTGSTTITSGNGSLSTTTTRPTARPAVCSASKVNQRYPHETKCERYYTCRLISGIYKYVELICRGTMVYNPTTTYCETPTLPSCRTNGNDAA